MAILNTGILSPETERAIEELGPSAERIADRWVICRPTQVRAMERDGSLLSRLKEHAKQEARTLADARVGGENSHLADHEILEIYGCPIR